MNQEEHTIQENEHIIRFVPGTILVHPDGERILMIRQPQWMQGQAWSCFACGGVELDRDDPQNTGKFVWACIRREVLEETGIILTEEECADPRITVVLGPAEHIPLLVDGHALSDLNAPATHMIFLNFVTYLQPHHVAQGLQLDSNEILEARWCTSQEALTLPLFGNIASQIKLAVEKGLIP